ncbi:hypothetical protein MLD38_000619 [Melastoma candidum]|uniref:Uncharacterized protein n=1 Tax=Melastoma candidum TaxID=119954 RepID=A0ACB9SBY2_9MYRT|nr:hypothetical protein MLD38_000619 [Melastoma candidum]
MLATTCGGIDDFEAANVGYRKHKVLGFLWNGMHLVIFFLGFNEGLLSWIVLLDQAELVLLLLIRKICGTFTLEMNSRTYYGRSIGDQVKEQTVPGHLSTGPRILMEGVSTVNLPPPHHNFMAHPMNFDASTVTNVYYPIPAPLAGPRTPAVPLNYGSPDHLVPSYNNMTVFGGSSEDFGRNQFKEIYVGSYGRKNAEGSVGSSHCGPYESSSTPVNAPVDTRQLYYEHPPQYGGGNEFPSIADDVSDWSLRMRSGSAGINFIHPTNYNGYIQGSHGAQPIQPAGPFPIDQTLLGNPALGLPGWNHPPAMPYMHGPRDYNLHQVSQMQGMRDRCFQFFPQVPAPHFPLLNGAIPIPMANPVVPRPRGSSRPIRVGTNQPQIRGMPETMQIHCDIPYLTYVDEVAILDLPEHYDIRHHADDHSDMRMDIENMSYEELLTLGEHIGNVNTGLSEESITNQLRTGLYMLTPTHANAEEGESVDREAASCIICLGEYESQEELGYLDCGHDYHADCLKQWLLVKNACPVCKTEALPC